MINLRSRIHQNYEFFLPCNQAAGTGTAIDVSGAGGTFAGGSGITDAQMWANSRYLSSRAAANGYLFMDKNAFRRPWTNTSSFLFHTTFKGAAPATTQGILGNGKSTTNTGWRLVGFQTSGDIRLDVYGASAGVTVTTVAAKLDSTDRHIVIAGDGPLGMMYMLVDNTIVTWGTTISTAGTITSMDSDFGIGIACPASGDTSVALQVYGMGYLTFPGRLPDQVGRMASWLYNNRYTPLPQDGWNV